MELILMLLTFITTTSLSKQIKIYYIPLVILSAIVSIISYFILPIESLLNGGFIGLGMFITVMYTTAFKKGSTLYKRTLLIRKELSILGFILLIPHFTIYLIGEFQVIEWAGIISAIIMVPLFITSFTTIKKKFSFKQWLNIQYFAYHAYILMFAHLFIVAQNNHRLIYGLILLVYVFLKIKNDMFKRINSDLKLALVLITLVFSLIFLYSQISYEFGFLKTPADPTIKEPSNPAVPEKPSEPAEPSTPVTIYKDGTFTGEASGFRRRDVEVKVLIENDIIKAITIDNCGCTTPYKGINFVTAVNNVAEKIVKTNSVEVDTVSGATYSTRGLIEAVKNALENANKKPE